ncbi:hypothetical protein [Endozoicomonas sp.]|uniref:hypothetical protein n=1 Tax=Endozoicomonas sp. TaxID=1892382 RepID=UPI003AF96508
MMFRKLMVYMAIGVPTVLHATKSDEIVVSAEPQHEYNIQASTSNGSQKKSSYQKYLMLRRSSSLVSLFDTFGPGVVHYMLLGRAQLFLLGKVNRYFGAKIPVKTLRRMSFFGVDALTGPVSANLGLCGQLTIEAKDGWQIDRFQVIQGTVNNSFLFSSRNKVNYKPLCEGSRLLEIADSTGGLPYYRMHFGYPVDLELVVKNVVLGKQASLSVKKGLCSKTSIGQVVVKKLDNTAVNLCTQNPILLSNNSAVVNYAKKLTTSFYSSAYLTIQDEDCPLLH